MHNAFLNDFTGLTITFGGYRAGGTQREGLKERGFNSSNERCPCLLSVSLPLRLNLLRGDQELVLAVEVARVVEHGHEREEPQPEGLARAPRQRVCVSCRCCTFKRRWLISVSLLLPLLLLLQFHVGSTLMY
jgi:hypothetical protein